MQRLLIIVIALVTSFAVMACNKNKTEVDNAGDVAQAPPIAEETAAAPDNKIEVAQGETRELLLTLQKVHFGLDSAKLIPQAKEALEMAAATLIKYPEVLVQVAGHTDERGPAEYNKILGEKRAAAVVDYLIELGVSKEQLSLTSFGEEELDSLGSTSKEHAQNRRADFRIMKGDVQLVLEEGVIIDDLGRVVQPEDEDETETAKNNASDQAEAARKLLEADQVAKAETGEEPVIEADENTTE